MSTEYMTRDEMTLAQFYEAAAEIGWVHALVDEREVVRVAEGSPMIAFDVRECVCSDGLTRIEFTRYGANDVSDLVAAFNCMVEYSEEYYELAFVKAKYEDLPESYRRDLEQRFEDDTDGFEEAVEETLECRHLGFDMPVRHLEMDTLYFINGKVARAFRLHYVHQNDDAYYEQWADVMGNNHISNCDIELSDKWNWCVENLKGNWSVSAERPFQSACDYTILIADEDDAVRFKLAWGSKD